MVHKHIKRLIIVAFIVLAAIALNYFGFLQSLKLSTFQQRADHLYNIVQQHYFFSVIFYCFIFISAVVFFLPVTVLLTLAAGFLFGIALGTCLVLISATAGGVIMFLTVRYVIGSYVQKKYAHALSNFNDDIKKYGSNYLLVLQLLPITPTLVINLFAGVSPISLWTYIWTTALGILPGTLIYAFAGRQIHVIHSVRAIMSWPIIIMLCLLAALALIPVLVRRYMSS